jgi:hypothetical protein
MTIRAFSQADFCKNLLNRSKRPLFLYSDHDAACKMTIRPIFNHALTQSIIQAFCLIALLIEYFHSIIYTIKQSSILFDCLIV